MEPFGFRGSISMVDEQSIVYYYNNIKKVKWTNIHHMYNFTAWKNGFLKPGIIPAVIHYINKNKPWNSKYNEWADLISFYKLADEAITSTGIEPEDIKLKSLNITGARAANDIYVKRFDKTLKNILEINN